MQSHTGPPVPSAQTHLWQWPSLPAGHCSITDTMVGFLTYSWPISPLLVLKAFSLRHFAQPVSTSTSSVCGWWGQQHPGNCTGSSTYSQRWRGQGEGLAGEPLNPSVPSSVSRGLQPAWKNSPLTKAQHKGPVSVGFSSAAAVHKSEFNFLLGSVKGRAKDSLPWKLLAHENLNLTNC